MDLSLPVVFIAFLLLVAFLGPLAEILQFLADVQEDMKHRNDRGLFKKPSSKHVM